jgi:Flp pilus assembly protein TadD
VGSQARADRYTYLPQIGLYVLLTWAAADLCVSWRHRRAFLGVGAAAILAALMVSARTQVAYWRNSETLWTHTLACTTGNVVAHNNLGEALLQMGRADEAAVQFREALEIQPNSAQAHNNLGTILAQKNEADEAIAHFQKALQIQPQNWEAHGNLASVLFYQKGRADEAMAHCQKALETSPDLAQAHIILGHILLQQGRDAEAMSHYQKVLQTEPDSPIVLNNIGWILATSPDANLRNGAQAVRYAKRACDMTKDSVPPFVRDLAAAYAEAGRFDEAVAAAQRAGALASAGGQLDVLEETRKELDLYLAHQPYHRPPVSTSTPHANQ